MPSRTHCANAQVDQVRNFAWALICRFAPLAVRLRGLLHQLAGPKAAIYTINAGAIPAKHWTQNADVGGGRIVGECCHFIDLLRYLIGAPISFFEAKALSVENAPRDSASITLGFVDGSIGTVHYFSNGARSFQRNVSRYSRGATPCSWITSDVCGFSAGLREECEVGDKTKDSSTLLMSSCGGRKMAETNLSRCRRFLRLCELRFLHRRASTSNERTDPAALAVLEYGALPEADSDLKPHLASDISPATHHDGLGRIASSGG